MKVHRTVSFQFEPLTAPRLPTSLEVNACQDPRGSGGSLLDPRATGTWPKEVFLIFISLQPKAHDHDSPLTNCGIDFLKSDNYEHDEMARKLNRKGRRRRAGLVVVKRSFDPLLGTAQAGDREHEPR